MSLLVLARRQTAAPRCPTLVAITRWECLMDEETEAPADELEVAVAETEDENTGDANRNTCYRGGSV